MKASRECELVVRFTTSERRLGDDFLAARRALDLRARRLPVARVMDFCRARDDVDGRTNAAAPAQDPAISLTDQRELFTTDGPRLQKDDVCAARRFDDRLLASGCAAQLCVRTPP